MAIHLVARTPPIREEGGALRVGCTRVTLESVLWAHVQGANPEDIKRQFPSLELADIYDVIAYYLRHRESIQEYLQEQERKYHETTEQIKKEFPQAELRARLLARLKQ